MKHFNITSCDSEQTLYEQLHKNKIDLILMDISLNRNKDGLQLTRELKNSGITRLFE